MLEMQSHGIPNAAALTGGWHAWEQRQLPVQSDEQKAVSGKR